MKEESQQLRLSSMTMENINCVVLTDNYMFFSGISNLIPGINYKWFRFEENFELPTNLYCNETFTFIDCNVLTHLSWGGLDTIIELFPISLRVWMGEEGARGFLSNKFSNEYFLRTTDPLKTLQRNLIKIVIQKAQNKKHKIPVLNLTETERLLLPYFATGCRVKTMTLFTGMPEKTIYRHRKNILNKIGIKSPSLLSYIFTNCKEKILQ